MVNLPVMIDLHPPSSDLSTAPQLSVITSVYRGREYLPGFLSNLSSQSMFPDIEVIFVLNQPDRGEAKMIADFHARFPQQVRAIEVPRVETIGASWNRALAVARGEFLAVWNVDDLREPHSLALQVESLVQRPDCAMAYGDFLIVTSRDSRRGMRWRTPRFNRFYFARSIPQGGAFLVWRHSMQAALGGFDEQLQAAPDYDFSLRAALTGYRMCRVPGILGYFLDLGSGLSTRDGGRRTSIEATLLHVRYGVFDKVKPQNLAELTDYRSTELKISGEWYSLSTLYPWYDRHMASHQYLWRVNSIRVFIVSVLRKLRLYSIVDFIRERLFRIDI